MTTKPVLLADILKPESNNFGFLRLAMALVVLVSHSFWLATGKVEHEPLHALTGYTLGEHGVQVFFFLSGVVVAQSIMRSGSLLDFAVARAVRILPALIVCVLLTAFVLGPLVTTLDASAYLADRGVLAYIVRTLSLSTGSAQLPGVFDAHPLASMINVSLWTLKYEVACYMLLCAFGLAWLRFERLRPLLVMALGLAVVLAFSGRLRPVEPLSGLGSLRYFVLFFFAGTLAYLARERLVITWLALPPLFVLFALAARTEFAELASAAFLGYATLCVAAMPMPGLRSFTNAQDYSYGVYILHCPIQQLVLHVKPGIGPLELTLVALALTVPLAALFWNVIEHPSLARRKEIVGWIRRIGSRVRARIQRSDAPAVTARPASGAPALELEAMITAVRQASARTALPPSPVAQVAAASAALVRRTHAELKSGRPARLAQSQLQFGRPIKASFRD